MWLVEGEIQRALDAAALAGANTVTVYVEIDRYGNIYNLFIESDPIQADADARDTFTRNTQDLQDTHITWVDVVMDGTKVKVTTEFEVDTYLLNAFIVIPPRIRLTRHASADCTVVPLTP